MRSTKYQRLLNSIFYYCVSIEKRDTVGKRLRDSYYKTCVYFKKVKRQVKRVFVLFLGRKLLRANHATSYQPKFKYTREIYFI